MKLLVIGASRGIGLSVVRQALDIGHEVSALARQATNMPHHPRLKVVTGDVLDLKLIEDLVHGQTAVCLTIGTAPSLQGVSVFSEGTKNVVEAMHKAACRRLACVTGVGAGDSKGHGGFLYNQVFQPLLLKTIYEDKDRQEAIIRQSGLDWVIVRPGFLTNGPWTGSYRALTDLRDVTSGRIARVDVAHFILRALAEGHYWGDRKSVV